MPARASSACVAFGPCDRFRSRSSVSDRFRAYPLAWERRSAWCPIDLVVFEPAPVRRRDGCAEGTVRSGLDASAEGAAVCDGTRDTVFLTTEGGRWPLRFVCTQAWRGRDCKQRCQSRSVDSRASLLVGAGNRGLFLQLDRILRRLFPVSGQAPERQGTPLLCPASPDE